MNILIVGNGFDLSHYLPTKYDHFMDVMDAIETHTGDTMSFEELFSKCRDEWFIEKTKKYYLTENITLVKGDLEKIRKLLKENNWYQFFTEHVKEVKTWIDFEQKIESALALVFKVINKIHFKFEKYGSIDTTIQNLTKTNAEKDDKTLYLTDLDMSQLIKLGLFTVNINYGEVTKSTFGNIPDSRKSFINDRWFNVKEKMEYGFSSEKYISYLNSQLDGFIVIFDLYLELVVSQLNQNSMLNIESEYWIHPDKIFSFNYTNTFQRIHDSVDVEYLHGSHGQYQNIVLGISDIEDEGLKKIKAFGFTKYHQKLFKDTDYLFLDEYKNKILSNRKSQIDLYEQLKGENRSAYRNVLNNKIRNSETMLDLKFYIWGHSLDVSDKDYIIDLFSLNDEVDRNVRVVVYHYDKPAKFSLLNNLLAILGKDKVEQWMKNKWLEFKPNPEVKFEIDSNLEEAS